MLEKLSENLFLFRDTCNVYIVRDGHRALLIDFGSGSVLDELSELGVSQVDWILHTHHHRDQCQGDQLANERQIPIAVPAHERSYFEEVEVFWGSRQIYDIYGYETKILAASIRHTNHMLNCALAGADVATVPFNVIKGLLKHPLTDIGLEKFLADYNKAFG